MLVERGLPPVQWHIYIYSLVSECIYASFASSHVHPQDPLLFTCTALTLKISRAFPIMSAKRVAVTVISDIV